MLNNLKKEKIFNLLFLSNIITFVVAILVSVFLEDKNLFSFFVIALSKTMVMLAIILVAFFNFIFLKNKTKTKYKKLIIIALSCSTLSDITIVFNFILGGVFSLFALIIFSFAFINYEKITSTNIKQKLTIGVLSFLCFSFIFFMFFFLVLYGKITPDISFFKILIPIYVFVQIFMLSSAYFGRLPFLIKIGAFMFYISDLMLFYKLLFGKDLFLLFSGLFLYLFAQHIFAYDIDE